MERSRATYFPQGKNCEQHKKRAMEYGAQLASEMKFYLLKRGVMLHSINNLLVKSFSTDAAAAAEMAKLDKQGRAVNHRQQMMQGEISMVDKCPWVDTTMGLLESELELEGKLEVKDPAVDPLSMVAFNFESDGASIPGVAKPRNCQATHSRMRQSLRHQKTTRWRASTWWTT